MARMNNSKFNIGHEVELIFPDMGFPDGEFVEDGPIDLASKEYCAWIAQHLTTKSNKWIGLDRDDTDPEHLVVKPEHDLDPEYFIDDQFAGVELVTPPRSLSEAQTLREEISRITSDLVESMSYMCRGPGGYGWHINLDMDGKKPDMLDFFLHAPEMAVLIETGRSEIWGCRTLKNSVLRNLLDRRLDRDTSSLDEEKLRTCLDIASRAGKEHAANFQRSNYVELRHYGAVDFLHAESLEKIIDRLYLNANLEHCRQEKILKLNATVDLLEGVCRSFETRLALSEEHHSDMFGKRTQTIHLDGNRLGIYRGKVDASQESGDQILDQSSLLITSDSNPDGFFPVGNIADHLSVEIIVNAYDYAAALDDEHVAVFVKENGLPEAFQLLICEIQDALSVEGLLDRDRDVARPGFDWDGGVGFSM
ncbi:hypothetical protein [Pseudosulfitobacter pseudonitzschiae]|uniref:hypothetical protein n=1 Tax=Pseudosulfitobacter pseudonitzschiae TaxID=1402135 RepID=UPI003B780F5C